MSTAWRPEPGGSVAGTVTALDEGAGHQGKPYPIVTLDVDGTVVKVHAVHQVLQQELAKRTPGIGDQLQITYHGQPPGKDYHSYSVTGGRPVSIDWGRYGDPAHPADDYPPSARPTPPSASGPAAPPASAAADGAATSHDIDQPAAAADLNQVSRLLEAIWHANSAKADEYRASINRAAGGPFDTHLTARQAAQTIGWLTDKAAQLGITTPEGSTR